MIPDHRKLISGRTYAQVWEPRPLEIHRRSKIKRVLDAAFAVVLGAGIAIWLWVELGAHL